MGAVINQHIVLWRRRIIAGAVVLICALAAVHELFEALRLALLPLAGPVGTRVILACLLLAIGGLAIAAIYFGERQPAASVQEEAQGPPTPEEAAATERAGVLAEAVHLGYWVGRRWARPKTNSSAPPPQPPSPEADAKAAQ